MNYILFFLLISMIDIHYNILNLNHSIYLIKILNIIILIMESGIHLNYFILIYY